MGLFDMGLDRHRVVWTMVIGLDGYLIVWTLGQNIFQMNFNMNIDLKISY